VSLIVTRMRIAAFVTLLVLVVATAGAGGYFETRAVRSHRAPSATPSRPVPAALHEVSAAPTRAAPPPPGRAPEPAAVRAVVRGPLNVSALGRRARSVRAVVRDVRTGRVLYSQHPTAPGAPASTAKLLTAAAVLSVYPATHRFSTSVVAGAKPGTVVLVGGGDPTLTAAPRGKHGAYPDAARLHTLAADLSAHHVTVRRIVVDDALFSGPTVCPAWAPEDVPSSYESAITPLMIDGGRSGPDAVVRSGTPDLAAGHAFAAALGHPRLPVSRGSAPTSARTLGRVRSAPLSELVGQMLLHSDDVLAEVLARQVALAEQMPASFAGAAAAIRSVLGRLGVSVGGGMRDGSGLAASDRLAATTLVRLVRLLAGPAHPRLHRVLAGLPVAGWSGTLAGRYVSGSGASSAAGTVRAKTGTLTGVSTLAGLVHDASGRLLAFAFLADDVRPTGAATEAAEAALDRAVAALGRCGCR
jgi:D-alanyl-D-alanine carboxypeptidase/D-alanyl-D-alanine-endopeptidase (penicillin-binding protein 4)